MVAQILRTDRRNESMSKQSLSAYAMMATFLCGGLVRQAAAQSSVLPSLAEPSVLVAVEQTGIRPTVTVLDPNSDTEFKDILVQVQEQPTGSLIFGVGVNSDAGLTGSIILNERN